MSLTKIPLSASTHGRGINVSATSIASGTTIHTAQATTTDGLGDELVLYATNLDSVSRILTIGWGGTSIGDLMIFVIASGVTTQIVPGLLIRNSLVVKASADAANKVEIFGFAIRSS